MIRFRDHDIVNPGRLRSFRLSLFRASEAFGFPVTFAPTPGTHSRRTPRPASSKAEPLLLRYPAHVDRLAAPTVRGRDAPKRLLQPKPRHVHPGTARLPGPGFSPRIREAPSTLRPTPAMRARFLSEFFLTASSHLAVSTIPAGARLTARLQLRKLAHSSGAFRVRRRSPSSRLHLPSSVVGCGLGWRATSDTLVAPRRSSVARARGELRTASAAAPSREGASSIRGAFHRQSFPRSRLFAGSG